MLVLSSKREWKTWRWSPGRKVTRRRPRKTKVWFNDGTFALPFTVVHLVQKTTKPAPKYVDAEDHQDLRTETVYLDKESGEVVAPEEVVFRDWTRETKSHRQERGEASDVRGE